MKVLICPNTLSQFSVILERGNTIKSESSQIPLAEYVITLKCESISTIPISFVIPLFAKIIMLFSFKWGFMLFPRISYRSTLMAFTLFIIRCSTNPLRFCLSLSGLLFNLSCTSTSIKNKITVTSWHTISYEIISIFIIETIIEIKKFFVSTIPLPKTYVRTTKTCSIHTEFLKRT